jgi:hypothetical protein
MSTTTTFDEIRNYLFLDLMMTEADSNLIARSVMHESEFTMEEPWDILSRILIQMEEESIPCISSY